MLIHGGDDMFEKMVEELPLKILEVFQRFLKSYEKAPPRILKVINRKQAKIELNVSDNTLDKWEKQGLKRYQAPGEDVRIIFYLVDDLHRFLGVENG